MGLNLDACPECAGIWFDDGELRQLVDQAPEALEALDARLVPELEVLTPTGSHRHCPRDNDVLATFKYAYDTPIKIDSCPTCSGVFVEDQELGAIHAALKDQDKSRVVAALAGRARFTGRTASSPEAGEKTVSGLIQALHHWRDQQPVG
jgi:Zn-finger nucleic acid-binding protein